MSVGAVASVQVLAQGLADAGGDVGPVVTTASRTVQELAGRHLRGDSARALEDYWHGTSTVAARIAPVLSEAARAVADYAVAMTDAQALEMRAVQTVQDNNIRLSGGQATLPPAVLPYSLTSSPRCKPQ